MTPTTLHQPKCRVLVISGGRSAEREVSLNSGRTVVDALRTAGYTVGEWDPAQTSVLEPTPGQWDIAFPMLHGTGGEDGVLHRQLRAVGLSWVGCSIDGSSLTFDKSRTRTRLKKYRVPMARGTTLNSPDTLPPFEFPLVVKPARQGSSIGISIVKDPGDWNEALNTAFSFCSEVVVESYIPGREISIPVIDGDVFPAVEINVQNGWYDYYNKYESSATDFQVSPADLPPNLSSLALEVCEACNVKGILRVDFRIDHSNRPYVLEINTIPGMTSHSLVPLSAAAAGLSLADLCDRCVQSQLQRVSVNGFCRQ
ncbi:MAG: D-alanine--D-alanine ligase [Fuerstiella sp.]|nr:D-alanine--D-alanine ligase [Fuerstiella sp.]